LNSTGNSDGGSRYIKTDSRLSRCLMSSFAATVACRASAVYDWHIHGKLPPWHRLSTMPRYWVYVIPVHHSRCTRYWQLSHSRVCWRVVTTLKQILQSPLRAKTSIANIHKLPSGCLTRCLYSSQLWHILNVLSCKCFDPVPCLEHRHSVWWKFPVPGAA